MDNSIYVKILVPFLSPLTNRMVQSGEHINVPEGIFWLRRINDGDCERSKSVKPKAQEVVQKSTEAVHKPAKSSKKGSK